MKQATVAIVPCEASAPSCALCRVGYWTVITFAAVIVSLCQRRKYNAYTRFAMVTCIDATMATNTSVYLSMNLNGFTLLLLFMSVCR